MCERTAWRVCRNRWWSVFGKKRGMNGKRPGPPVHDDLVKRDFTADDVNERRRRPARLGRLTPLEYETIMNPTVSLAA